MVQQYLVHGRLRTLQGQSQEEGRRRHGPHKMVHFPHFHRIRGLVHRQHLKSRHQLRMKGHHRTCRHHKVQRPIAQVDSLCKYLNTQADR